MVKIKEQLTYEQVINEKIKIDIWGKRLHKSTSDVPILKAEFCDIEYYVNPWQQKKNGTFSEYYKLKDGRIFKSSTFYGGSKYEQVDQIEKGWYKVTEDFNPLVFCGVNNENGPQSFEYVPTSNFVKPWSNQMLKKIH